MSALTSPDRVIIDLAAADKGDAIRQLAQRLVDAGDVTDLDAFVTDLEDREARAATGLPGGIAIPHAKSDYVTAPALAFGLSHDGVPFGAADGPAHLIFVIAAPSGNSDAQLRILARLARRLTKPAFKEALQSAPTAEAASEILNRKSDAPLP